MSSPPSRPPLARSQSTVELLPSEVSLAVQEHGAAADRVISRAAAAAELEDVDVAAHESKLGALAECVFVGHTNTDMDSIGSAIAGAELFGGTAARASEVNSETRACLARWGLPLPPLFKELPACADAAVCLVDHQQTTQMAEGVREKQVRGIIDHHSLKSETVCTAGPVYVDIRPWGSACTIIAYTFFQLNRTPSRTSAGMMLSGILSDTLNLQGPTTTRTDRMMVAALAKLAHVEDINELASFQFRAKSEALEAMTDTEILMSDHKVFKFNVGDDSFRVGFGVVECVGEAPAKMLARKAGFVEECAALKNSLDLRYSFFAVVDIVNLRSTLILCGLAEREVAVAAFGGAVGPDGDTMDLGSRVSRKNDFIKNGINPVLTNPDFQVTPPALQLSRQQSDTPASPLALDPHGGGCCGRVTRANKLKKVGRAMVAAVRLQRMSTPRPDAEAAPKQGDAAASGAAAGATGGACCGHASSSAATKAPVATTTTTITAGGGSAATYAVVALAAAAVGFVLARASK